MNSMHWFSTFILVLGYLGFSDAVHCYQCGDSTKDGKCVTDTAGMEAEYKRWNNTGGAIVSVDGVLQPYKYIKNCSSPFCVIERIEEMGQMHAYIRDCSDGKQFSLNSTYFYDNLVSNLNHTKCLYISGSRILACVSLCHSNLCNGPQIVSRGSYNARAQIWMDLMIAVAVLFVVTRNKS